MSWLKRILLITTAVILFVTAAVSAYAAPSPHKEDHYVITTEDGFKVILWRMPEYLYKLSAKGQRKYERFLPLEPGEVLYLGEVEGGKFEGYLFSLLEINNINPVSVASMDAVVLEKPQGVYLLSSGLGIKAIKLMTGVATKLADNSAAGAGVNPVAEIRKDLYAAYAEIKKSEGNLSGLQPGIVDKAAAAGVPLEDCKVTQLFDLTVFNSAEELEKSTEMGRVKVTVAGKSINNLVCILHRHLAKWEMVNDAKAADGVLTFTTDTMSPFAVITWGNEGIGTATKQSPKTGDNTYAWIGAAAAMVVMLTAAAYVLINAARKRRQ